jgi:hypothetical protein
MPKKCAYCDANKNMTREHIFPASIIPRDETLLSFTDKTASYFNSDLTKKDVCKACNNGPLSKLDDNFLEIYNKYIRTPIEPGDSAEITFDYNSLLRFLLKVSYNSARISADGQQAIEVLKSYVPFILGISTSTPDISLRLQIYTSAKTINESTGEKGIAEAKLLRSAKVSYRGPQSDSFIIRLVAINSFWFHLLIPLKPMSRIKKESFTKGFKNWILNPGIAILPQHKKLFIPANKTSYIHPAILNGMYRKNP